MAKDLPKKWFPNTYLATIRQGKVDRYAESNRKFKPYFDTWDEAHEYLKEQAALRDRKAKSELKASARNLARVKNLMRPDHA